MKKRKKVLQSANDALVEETEVELLLQGVLNCYGFDFRQYAVEPLKRRIWDQVQASGALTLSGYQEKVLHEPAYLERLLCTLTVRPMTVFQDPPLWEALRTIVAPILRTYPAVQFWVPGCATGEDAYALAILLHEEGLLARSRIYATDLSDGVLQPAREGVFRGQAACDLEEQYVKSGGKASFAEYARQTRTHLVMAPFLKAHIVFAAHCLATDGPFNEFQVIVCRSVLSTFNDRLQERVHDLFLRSLSRFGILALGPLESPRLPLGHEPYERLTGSTNLYRKVDEWL